MKLANLETVRQAKPIVKVPKKVITLCRYNQARSIIASSTLASVFPVVYSSSAGINAIDNNPIPESIVRIAREWGIQLNSGNSRSLLAAETDLSEADLVIVAELGFLNEIPAQYLVGKQIFSMQDSRFSPQFIPVDPINLSPNQVKIELAKSIMTTTQLVAQAGLRNYNYEVQVYIPESIDSFKADSINAWRYAKEIGANLLFANFRAPDFINVRELGANVRELVKINDSTSSNLMLGSIKSKHPYVVATKYEIDDVEMYALSNEFKKIIEELSRERRLLIMTGPLKAGLFSFSDPFLIASHATRCINSIRHSLDT